MGVGGSYTREPTELIHCTHIQLLTVHSTFRPEMQHPAASASWKPRGQAPQTQGGRGVWNMETEVRDLCVPSATRSMSGIESTGTKAVPWFLKGSSHFPPYPVFHQEAPHSHEAL